MKGKNKCKKILAVLLTVIITATLTPANVLAKQPKYKGNTGRISKLYKGTELNKLPNIKSQNVKVKSKLDSKLSKLTGKEKNDSGKTNEELKAEMKALKQLVPKGAYIQAAKKTASSDVAHVYIKLKTAEGRKIVEPYTFKIVNEDKVNKLLSAWVDTNKLEQLEALDEVVKIDTVVQPKTNVDKEGDELHRAKLVRELPNGSTGTGIKVGVISDGVDHLSDSIAKGALTSQVNVLSNVIGGDEGTAMLEIVHALAPGADLYFHDSGVDVLDFNNAIDTLAAEGCNIIVDDISWIAEPFFEDGIVARHVKEVIDKTGIIYTSSAGNFAESHYSGLYYNDGSNNNDFSSGKESEFKYLYVEIQPWHTVTVVLQWDDPFNNSVNDYDLFLRNDARGNLASSNDKQQGVGSSPLEVVEYTNTTSSTIEARIDVNNYNGAAAPKMLSLYIYGDNYTNNIVASNSIFGQAAVPEVITAGAIEVSSPNDIASYSSQGPVVHLNGITRKKPDVCGAAGVSVTGVGGFSSTFSGTSAAAPHIAAIAALLWSKNTNMTNTEIRNLIVNNPVDLGLTGVDDIFGYGRADAYNAFMAMNPIEGNKPASGVTLDRTQVNLEIGEAANLTATVSPIDASNKNVMWSSSNPLVAAVDGNGKVSAVEKGTATIKVTTMDGGYTASCSVTVVKPVTGISLDKTQVNLKVGEAAKLTATVSPIDATNKNVTWSSSNTSVALVDSNGKVTASGKGTATIKASTVDGGYNASCNVTIVQPVTAINLDKTQISLKVGEETNLIATVNPTDASNKNVMWSSSNPLIAAVDSNGKVSAVGKGTVTITVTTVDGGYTASCGVTVIKSAAAVSLDKDQVSLKVGEDANLIATVNPTDASNKNVMWSSSNPLVASVDSNGKVSAVGKGTATITVTTVDGGYTASCGVTVVQPVTGISLDKTQISLKGGEAANLIATVSPTDASNRNVMWLSSNPLVASVDSNGKVSAAGKGTATITVITVDGGYTASCTVTVVQPVTGISLDKTEVSMKVGEETNLISTIIPSNADNKNVLWISSNPLVAKIDSSGKVSAAGKGNATITVTAIDGGYTASCTVTVTIETVRYGGASRFDTSVQVSKAGWQTSENVVLVNAYGFADALTGVPFAYIKDAPILLTEANSVPKATSDEISRLGAKNIYILGGTGVISQNIEDQLRSKQFNVVRLAGTNRFDTAVQIGNEVVKNSSSKTAIITTAYNYPDALSISSYAAIEQYPILYTETNILSEKTKEFIKNNGITKVIIPGGQGAVSEAVATELRNSGITVERTSGQNRYETAVNIVNKYKSSFKKDVILATGMSFPDALAGGVLAAKKQIPILLVDNGYVSDGVKNYIKANGDINMYILGGTGVVPDSIIDSIKN